MSVHKHGTTGPGCAGTCCLKATDLGVSFGGEEVLRDVSFHLHCGEIVALIGPNGAGKSSLFRTILGQVPHTGTIEFQRAGGDKTRPLIGYVPQSPSFDRGDPVSVFDFFSAAISRYPVFLPSHRSLRARVGACLARVHGESLLDRRMGALSGGELQRVLLALALEPLPHILVLDEPLSGVDIDGEKQLLDMLDEIRTRYDLSILLSTHDFATLGQFADKVILLKGTVLRVGPPDEVLASPEFQEVFHLNLGKGNLGKGGRADGFPGRAPGALSLAVHAQRPAGGAGNLAAVRPALHHGGHKPYVVLLRRAGPLRLYRHCHRHPVRPGRSPVDGGAVGGGVCPAVHLCAPKVQYGQRHGHRRLFLHRRGPGYLYCHLRRRQLHPVQQPAHR